MPSDRRCTVTATHLLHAALVQSKWGADLYSSQPRPMFKVRLVMEEGKLNFEPSLADIRDGILASFDSIITRSNNIEDITSKASL